jgi:glutaredoxin
MMKQVVIFSMESCPFCTLMKDMLNENQIPFIDMDIDKHVEDYEMFKELVDGNDFVPAVMIIDESKTRKITPFAPERDYKTLEEGIEKIKSVL